MKTPKDEYIPSAEESTPTTGPGAPPADGAAGGGGASRNGKGRPFNLALYKTVRDDPRVPHVGFRLWCRLYDMAGSSGRCYPGVRALRAWLQSTERTIIKCRKILEGLRYMVCEKITAWSSPQPHKHGGFFYTFPDDALSKSERTKANTYWRTLQGVREKAYASKRSPESVRAGHNKTLIKGTKVPPKSPSGGLGSSGAARRDGKRVNEKNRESDSLRADAAPGAKVLASGPESGTPEPEALKEEKGAGTWTKKAARWHLAKCLTEIERLKHDEGSYVRILKPWISERCGNWPAEELRKLKEKKSSWTRGEMQAAARQRLAALQAHRQELEAVLHPAAPKDAQIRIPSAGHPSQKAP